MHRIRLPIRLRGAAKGALSFALVVSSMSVGFGPYGRAAAAGTSTEFHEPSGSISLGEASAAALERSPDLAAASDEIRAREALALQAARRSNPVVQTEVENVGVSGERRGFDDTETTLLLSQLIELGDKRRKRARVAEAGGELAHWDFEVRRLDVLSRVRRAFVTVLAAQARADLAVRRKHLAEQEEGSVGQGVAAGAASPFELSRVRLTVERAGLDVAQAESELRAARDSLAATWGGQSALFTKAIGSLTPLPRLPDEDQLIALVAASPEIARWTSERKERQASLELEEARSTPDITAGVGARHFSDNSDNALVFEVSVPLPLFDRNQDAVAAARARVSKADHESAAAAASARASVHETYQRSTVARANAERLARVALPAARSSHQHALAAFREGAIRKSDLLESERTVVELESEYVSALESVHRAVADLERLTAAQFAALAGQFAALAAQAAAEGAR